MITNFYRVEFNCAAATLGANHVTRIYFLPTPLPSERRVNRQYGVCGNRTQFLLTPRQCAIHYSTDLPTFSLVAQHSVTIPHPWYPSPEEASDLSSVSSFTDDRTAFRSE